jgi:uncharacterized BrkB/YihY/UPF0761 family membrane protein
VTRHTYWKIAKESVGEFWEDSFHLAAALSFYTLLSLSPLVLIVVAAAGLVWSEASVRAQLLNEIRELVGQAGAETVRTVLEGTTVSGRNIGSMVETSVNWRRVRFRASVIPVARRIRWRAGERSHPWRCPIVRERYRMEVSQGGAQRAVSHFSARQTRRRPSTCAGRDWRRGTDGNASPLD